MTSFMRILAIDPGFGRMGVAVLESGLAHKIPHVSYSACITTNPKDALKDRLFSIGSELERIITAHSPQVLAIEKLFFAANQKTALSVAEARGVALYEAARQGLSIFEYTPLQIKTAVTGYGGAPKQQVADMVMKLVSFAPQKKNPSSRKIGDDEFDAIAIGITQLAYLHSYRQ